MTVVTIARGSYSGGTALAECVAKRLGYECVSREENLEAAAALYGGPVERLASEKAPHLWERLEGKTDNFPYHIYVRAALAQRAQGGNLVYHGYLGHLLLPDFPNVLRVRVVADLEYRLNAVMGEHKLDRDGALTYIENVDQERREWVGSLFGVDWDDLTRYDVVVNISLLGIDAACDAVARLAKHKRFAQTAASKKSMKDLALASLVSAGLVRDPATASAELKVAADSGVVIVRGTTTTDASLDSIPLVVGRVRGVRKTRVEVKVGSADEE